MTVNDLVLFAQNTSALYPRHLELARTTARIEDWVSHVRRAVLPAYRHDCNEPCEGMSLEDMAEVAHFLRAYYLLHICE